MKRIGWGVRFLGLVEADGAVATFLMRDPHIVVGKFDHQRCPDRLRHTDARS